MEVIYKYIMMNFKEWLDKQLTEVGENPFLLQLQQMLSRSAPQGNSVNSLKQMIGQELKKPTNDPKKLAQMAKVSDEINGANQKLGIR